MDQKEKVIRPTTLFGDTGNLRSGVKILKEMFKGDLIRSKYVDHPKTFAQRNKGQRGPARREQTFLVSFPYEGAVSAKELEDFKMSLKTKWSLQVHYESCLFRDQPAWQVVIADIDVALEDAVEYARNDIEKI